MARAKKKVAKKKASSKTRKKTAKKKPSAKKKAPAKKKTSKKVGAKKTSKKAAAKKTAKKKPSTKKKAVKKAKSAPKKTAKKKASKSSSAADKFPSLDAGRPRKVPAVELSHGSDPIRLHHRKPSAKEIKKLREMLVERLKLLHGDVEAMESEAFSDSTREISNTHIADSSADQYEQHFTLHMIENETNELRMIQHALTKIDKTGDYGRCESCGIWISLERLKAKPFARICIHCIETFEKEGGGERFGIMSTDEKY